MLDHILQTITMLHPPRLRHILRDPHLKGRSVSERFQKPCLILILSWASCPLEFTSFTSCTPVIEWRVTSPLEVVPPKQEAPSLVPMHRKILRILLKWRQKSYPTHPIWPTPTPLSTGMITSMLRMGQTFGESLESHENKKMVFYIITKQV